GHPVRDVAIPIHRLVPRHRLHAEVGDRDEGRARRRHARRQSAARAVRATKNLPPCEGRTKVYAESIAAMFWNDTRAAASESPQAAALSCSITKCFRPARDASANTGLKAMCPVPTGPIAVLLTRALGPSEGLTVFRPNTSFTCHSSKRPGCALNRAS